MSQTDLQRSPRESAPQVAVALKVVLAVLLLALEYFASRQIALFDVRPEVLLLATCLIAVQKGPRLGMFVGFWAGLGADLFTNVAFGTSAFAYVLAGAAAGAMGRDARSTPLVQAVLVFVSSALAVLIFAVVASIVGPSVGSAKHIVWVAFIVALINAVVTPVASRLFLNRGANSLKGRW